jgi:amino acid adenylation domain-containing protein
MAEMSKIEDIYPLSPLQERLLLRGGAHRLVCRLRGELDRPDFERAWQWVIDQEPMLRTSFVWKRVERPLQAVNRRVSVSLEYHDRRNAPRAAQEGAEAGAWLGAEFDCDLNPAKAPLLRLLLCRASQDIHYLVCNYHQLILDERSMMLALAKVFVEYENLRRGKKSRTIPMRSYKDYIDWLGRQDAAEARSYWGESLKGSEAPVSLDMRRLSSADLPGAERSARQQARLDRAAVEVLMTFERRHGAPAQALAAGAWALLLSRYGGGEDILFGVPVSGRPPELEGAQSMIGSFANLLPLRTRVEEESSALGWLNAIQDRQRDLERYAFWPAPSLHEWTVLPESPPLFESVLIWDEGVEVVAWKRLGSLEVDDVCILRKDAPLEVRVIPGADARIDAVYDRRRFDGRTIADVLERFKNLLGEMASNPARRLSEVAMMGEMERHRILVGLNNTKRSYPREKCIHQFFEEQVSRAPDAVAVTFGDMELTYEELNGRANQLARYLRNCGVGHETAVAVCVERSFEMIIGALAILKAGGAYLPLDPAYPLERLSFMLEDAQAPVLVTQEHLAERLPAHWGHLIFLDGEGEIWAGEGRENLANSATAENLAYITYTSGSTGRPKGVEITHRAVARLIKAADYATLTPGEVFLQLAPLTFDASTFEIWGSLLNGARLIVMPPQTPSLRELGQALKHYGVTTLWLTSGLFHLMVDERLEELKGVRQLLAGGDVLSVSHVEKALWGLPDCRLINGYGPTEGATFTCCYTVPRNARLVASVPIGGPIANTRVYLLDRSMRIVPMGIAGELFIGGDGLARGYHRRPDLTAERFIPDAFGADPGGRLYRTGDLAQYHEDGVVEFLGRLDNQAKIAGYRIEPGEVEAALVRHPAVRQAVVATREVTGGGKRMAAYVVATSGKNLTGHELRLFLAEKLPEFMLPSAFVLLDALPLTPNGKVDRAALPAPEISQPELIESFAPPRTREERELAEIWAETLGVERVGIDDNFFDLGGDSMRSIQVLSKAERRGMNLTLQSLFERQTIRSLAEVLVGQNGQDGQYRRMARGESSSRLRQFDLITESDRGKLPADLEDAYPLAALQLGMLFHSEYSPGSAVYHDIFSFHLNAPFNAEALLEAMQHLAARHAVLRTSFDLSGYSEPLQLVHRAVVVPAQIFDLRRLSGDEQEEELKVWFETEKRRGFDWNRAPLLRLTAHRRSEQTFQFCLSFHHAILDGWSVATLLTELFHLYFTSMGEELGDLGAPPESTYRDFIAQERAALKSEEARRYWMEKLEGAPSARLPRRLAACSEGRGQTLTVHIHIAPEVADGLRRLAQAASAPLKSALLAAHLRVMSFLTGQSDVLTGVVTHRRPEASDGDRALGLFLNTLPFRLRLKGGTWLDLARQTFEAEQEAMRFRHYPMAQAQGDRGGQTLFDTGFNYTHFHVYRGIQDLKAGLLLGEDVFAETELPFWANFDLDALTSSIGLSLTVDVNEFSAEQAASFAGYYANTLAAMAIDPKGRYELAPLLPAGERERLLNEWNSNETEYDRRQFFHLKVEEQARLKPEAVAIVSETGHLTYQTLNARSNQLAWYLRQFGAGPDAPVAICLERSVDMLVGVLGILKTGAAYVPLDASHPPERQAFILEDTGAQIVVTQGEGRGRLPAREAHVVCLDSDWQAITKCRDSNPAVELHPGNLAYVIYTSGSTGKPKGTMIEHRSVINLMTNHPVTLQAHEMGSLRVSLNAPLIFDASVQQIMQLAYGHTLFLIPEDLRRNGDTLLSDIRRHRLDMFVCTPSQLKLLLAAGFGDEPDFEPKFTLVGGEALDVATWTSLGAKSATAFYNAYGPTECTVDTTICLIDKERLRPSIGRPLPNTRVYVLDSHLEPVPTGTAGELYVAGAGLARGYVSRSELTAERFLPDPFGHESGARMYSTGDVALYLPDGYLEFLGRLDDQIKLRGFRIEPAEISETLAQHPSVREAFVMMREDKPGDQRLVAYVVADESPASLVEKLRNHLHGKLPAYMLPTSYMFLHAMPLTLNGKVDRRALPPPEFTRAEMAGAFISPRNGLERRMTRVWEDVLGVKPIGARDNFFSLGGHSLSAVRLMALIGQRFGKKLPLSALFSGATVEDLTGLLCRQEPQGLDDCLIPLHTGGAGRPLFCAHPTGGHIFCYADLARHLGADRPLYGIQARGVEGALDPHTEVEAMATHYINSVLTVQPEGPYFLAGWSLGGAVAFEMCRQLQAQGDEVALLALLDTRAPSSREGYPDELALLADFAQTLGVDWRRLSPSAEEFSRLDGDQRLSLVVARAKEAELIPPEMSFDDVRRLFKVYNAHAQAGLRYDPPAIAARVTLMKASETWERHSGDYTEGWSALAAGGLESHQVPGTHFTMLREPHVALLAEQLRACLANAERV